MKLLEVHRRERPALAWAAAWFFCVLASYYAIRPVRESFGVSEGPARLRWLYTGTLVAMLVVAPIYGLVVRRTPRPRLPTLLYGFFAANLLAFWCGFSLLDSARAAPLRWTFYVWVSVFNLYAVTLLWSAAVELFTAEQATRLFGVVAASGTLGGLCGSELARAILRATSEPRQILLLSAALLVAALGCSWPFRKAALAMRGPSRNEGGDLPNSVGGTASSSHELQDAFGGIRDIARSPYLTGLAALMVLSSIAGTGIYMQMADLVHQQIPGDAARTDWYARLNNYQNALTLVGQLTAVGWLMRRMGLAVTLAIVPAVYMLGFPAIALVPTLAVLGAVDVAQRVAAFAAGVPAREVLFTTVQPDEKYRAKAFIDTVGKRAGDAAAAHGYAGLRAIGWAPTAIAWATMPVAALIAAISIAVARQHEKRKR